MHSDRVGVSQVLSRETRISAPSPTQLKTDQLSQTFVTINNMKFADTKTKLVIGAVTIKTILFILARNMFGLLPINGYDMNKRSVEISVNLIRKRKGL
jgi:hypothetical protein